MKNGVKKAMVAFLIVLTISLSFNFPFRLKEVVAQAEEKKPEKAVFYCSRPLTINNDNQYFVFVSNPEGERITLEVEGETVVEGTTVTTPIPINYEPLISEQKVDVDTQNSRLTISSKIAAFVLHSPSLAIDKLVMIQVGGNSFPIESVDDCEKVAVLAYNSYFKGYEKIRTNEKVDIKMDVILSSVTGVFSKSVDLFSQKIKVNEPGIIVVGDIHGNYGYIEQLIKDGVIIQVGNEWKVADGYKIIFLGDFFDRGGEAAQVLDVIISLYKNSPEKVIIVLGNHDVYHIFRDYRGRTSLFLTPWNTPKGNGYPTDVITDPKYQLHLDFLYKNGVIVYLEDGALYVHGGMPPELASRLDEIKGLTLKALVEKFGDDGALEIAKQAGWGMTSSQLDEWSKKGTNDIKEYIVPNLEKSAPELEKKGVMTINLGHRTPGRYEKGLKNIGKVVMNDNIGKFIQTGNIKVYLWDRTNEGPIEYGKFPIISKVRTSIDTPTQEITEESVKERAIEVPQLVEEGRKLAAYAKDALDYISILDEKLNKISDSALSGDRTAAERLQIITKIIDELSQDGNYLALRNKLQQNERGKRLVESIDKGIREIYAASSEGDLVKALDAREYITMVTRPEKDRLIWEIGEYGEAFGKVFDKIGLKLSEEEKAKLAETIKKGDVKETAVAINQVLSQIKPALTFLDKMGNKLENFLSKHPKFVEKARYIESNRIFRGLSTGKGALGFFLAGSMVGADPIITEVIESYWGEGAAFCVHLILQSVGWSILVITTASMVANIIVATADAGAAGFRAAVISAIWGGIVSFILIEIAIVAIKIACCKFLTPNTSFCSCDFSSAQFAIVKEGTTSESNQYKKGDISFSASARQELRLFVKNAKGGCANEEYTLTYLTYVPCKGRVCEVKNEVESYQPLSKSFCKMMPDSETTASCSVYFNAPEKEGSYKLYLIRVGKIEDVEDPLKWLSSPIYVGILDVRKGAAPTPSQPTQPIPTIGKLTCDGNTCKFDYTNSLDESFKVRFYFIDPETKKVVDIDDKTIPAKGSGSVSTKQFTCPQKGKTYNVMFQIFKSSDNNFANPLKSPATPATIGEIKC